MPKAGYNDRKHQFTKISTIHMLDNKVSQIESKLEKLIDCKFGEKMDAISTNEKLKEQSQFSTEVKTYAEVLGVPRQIMQEAKNDEKGRGKRNGTTF